MVVSRPLLYSAVGGGRSRIRLEALRLLSSNSPSNSPSTDDAAAAEKDDFVSMAYHIYGNRAVKCATTPLVIEHGLFGQMKNWHGIATNLAERLGNITYVVDWRNHGESPHHSEHSYPAMARDLGRFLREVVQPQTGFEKANLLGYSMRGRAVACFSLGSDNQPLLNKLIIEDIAPHRGTGKDDKNRYCVRVTEELDLSQSKPDLERALREKIDDHIMHYLILSNLRRQQEGKHEWQLNLEALDKGTDHITSYTIDDSEAATPFNGPTLLIAGEDSIFTRLSDETELREHFFPKLKLVTIPDTGHLVHFDQWKLFIDAVVEFLKGEGC